MLFRFPFKHSIGLFLRVPTQAKQFFLQQILQISIVFQEARDSDRLSSPVPTVLIFSSAVEVNRVVKCTRCNPFELF